MPPRFLLLVLPPVLAILFLFIAPKGRAWTETISTEQAILLHMVRLPVELVLFLLYTYKQVPQLMTFEGGNLDILSGLSAPMTWWLYKKGKVNKTVLLTWNFICLGLLVNIVSRAVLTAPLPFQQLAFDQPNVGMLYFPFVWLPCFIVPAVLFCHLAVIRKLLTAKA